MIAISFCKLDCFFKYFGFMKTIKGKGWFDLFCSGLFLVASNDLIGYIIAAVLTVCGIFFLVLGYTSKDEPNMGDYDPKNL